MANSTIHRSYTPNTKIVHVTAEKKTLTNNSVASYDVGYSEDGYICIPIGVQEYRSFAGWYVHYKVLSVGGLVFDYVNQTGATIDAAPVVVFLCIKT